MRHSVRHSSLPGLLMIVAVCGPGCSSVLSTASLKDLVWDAGDHAAELEPAGDEDLADAGEDGLLAEGGETAAADAERREAAIEAAVERLARLGELPPSVRMTLVETLERTEQEDWPTVVDAFAESLAESDLVDSSAAREPAPLPSEPAAAEDDALAEAAEPGEGEPHTVAKADLDAAVGETSLAVAPLPTEPDQAADDAATPEPLPVAATAAAADETVEVASTPAAGSSTTAPAPASATASGISATDPAPDLATVPERSATAPAPPAGEAPAEIAVPEPPPAERLTIQNACFASRVQAWGILDRFASDRFRPGQEVIVYFELDGLSAGESPAGHTTCIDSTLRLVAAGTLIRDWSFEPIAETCRARRHDYFARYVVRIPDDAPAGPCQLELAVTDTLSGEQATTLLPLEISRP